MLTKQPSQKRNETLQKQPSSMHSASAVNPTFQSLHGGQILDGAIQGTNTLAVQNVMQLQQKVGNRATGMLLAQARQIGDNEASVPGEKQGSRTENHTGIPCSLKRGLEVLSGFNLSGIRVHRNSTKPEQLNAWAYTQGQNIYIGPGQERYLPHEGWHVVQQIQGRVRSTIQVKGSSINDEEGLEKEADVMGRRALQPIILRNNGSCANTAYDPSAYQERTNVATHPRQGTPSAIQRAMKFEFQTRNYIWRTMGENNTGPEKLPRKFGPNDFLHKVARESDAKRRAEGEEGTGMELQSETDGFIEFETPKWFRKWSSLKERIQAAVDMTKLMSHASPAASGRREFPFNVDHLVRQRPPFHKYLRPGEKLEVEIVDPSWNAAIQSSEGISLTQYESLLEEHERPEFVGPVISSAQNILIEAVGTSGISLTNLGDLRSFLQIIVNYIKRGQRTNLSGDPAKFGFRLMSRTSFSSIYRSLLSDQEKILFGQIVSRQLILNELGLTTESYFFKHGHGGGVGPTVHRWLKSIINPTRRRDRYGKIRNKEGEWTKTDLLSRPRHGSHAMGAFDVKTAKGKKDTGLVKFEVRGTVAHGGRVQPANKWVAYARELFKYAATKRKRPNVKDDPTTPETETEKTDLIYDEPAPNLFILELALEPREEKAEFEFEYRRLLPELLNGRLQPFIFTGIGTSGFSLGAGVNADPFEDMSLFLGGKAGIRTEWFNSIEVGGGLEAGWAFGANHTLRLGVGWEVWQKWKPEKKRKHLLSVFFGARF